MSDIETIMSKIAVQPYLLNSLTAKYLQTMSSAFNSSVMKWEELHQIMQLLQNNEEEQGEELHHSKALLLMNTVRIVLMETFPTAQLTGNRLYVWFFMNYGVRINKIIGKMGDFCKQLQGDRKNEELVQILYELIMFGLAYSEIIFCILESYTKKNPSNKMNIPEFYRFIWIALETIQKYSDKIRMKIRLPNLGISQTQPLPDQQQQQQQQHKQITITPQTITITQIFKIWNIIQKNPNKKIKGKIEGAIFYKCIELLQKSFKCSNKKSVRQIGVVVEEINPIVDNLYRKMISENDVKNNQNKKEDVNFEIKNSIEKYLIKAGLLGFSKDQGQQDMEMDEEKAQSSEQQPQNNIIEVRQLTPRFIDEEPGIEIKKLKKKKNKLMKKIQSDIRRSTFTRVQEQRVLDDVRNERSTKREKKQMFILQKQTEEAKKFNKQTKKIKMIQKDSKKGSKKGGIGPMKKKK